MAALPQTLRDEVKKQDWIVIGKKKDWNKVFAFPN
jgi:hypothetical protein